MIRQIAGEKALLFKIAESGGKAFSGKKRLLKKGYPYYKQVQDHFGGVDTVV
jgi:hypothetical protein